VPAFSILLVANFSGERSDGIALDALRARRVPAVDRDNVDDVLASFEPALRFSLGGPDAKPTVSLNFRSLDDFHPDRLVQNVNLLRSLNELRGEALAGRYTQPSVSPESAPATPPATGGGSLLDQIVSGSSGAVPVSAEPPDPSDLHGYIRHILKPHLVAEPDAKATALAAQIEDAMAAALRAVLHDAAFQRLESAWRGVAFLVGRLETDATLNVHLFDMSREELASDLAPGREIGESSLLRVVRRGADGSGADPFALVALLSSFGSHDADVALLQRLAEMARACNATVLAGGEASLVGLPSFVSQPEPEDVSDPARKAWTALRASPDARYVGLVAPRYLLRAPYDPRDEPCETLEFMEMTTPPAHEDYLWGNSSLVGALLMGQVVAEGAAVRGAPVVEGLPVHIYKVGGLAESKPCGEALLTDRVSMRMMELGVMPLLSMKGGDTVRLGRFQSVAEPVRALAGAGGAVLRAGGNE
jgi:type VI secretion system protein ImpC